MVETRRWLTAISLCAIVVSGSSKAAAQEPDYTDVNAYILQADMALQR